MEGRSTIPINNAFYDELDEMWHGSTDHPVALLRAENDLRNPWIQKVLENKGISSGSILDIGCGGGFLTHFLAKHGHRVKGVDLSLKSLDIAKKLDSTQGIEYTRASAYSLPYEDASFDVCCAMDLLEHVENPAQVVREASRVLKKGGLFFFHTFNRNLLSYFMVIKGVEWCFSNAPPNMHVYPLFIKPSELSEYCENHGLQVEEIKGVRPHFSNKAFWRMVFKRKVEEDFRFVFTSSLKTGYSGFAQKK